MLKIEIKTGGAAFSNENDDFDPEIGGAEIQRILSDVVRKIKNGYDSGSAMDINGNKVCTWSLK